MFENAIQACVDPSQHIATAEYNYDGDSSKQSIDVLAENHAFDDETAATLKDAVGFRNILAHEYGHVNSEEVYRYLQTELEIYDDFSQQVASWYSTTTGDE